ncbi:MULTISPECIES: ABC transporter permease [unclassified Rhizobium]|uniref:ABC transporter permease n=1 Tax=unclassified Rhizobium TaxID=2613769 RepID=UPI001A99C7C0|nr:MULTISPECIES: ABC transporter permease [unclassified Rhizobium]MBX5164231.1 ABC transporter permease [Rhizobium sp. NZLR4b]MBX5192764.1 ABC transporter permease [Rhizobium sp. NZLR3b]MBX5195909.1 ABC transporter permease [Rhizobium sp. NZLR10]MBX5201785.1 ABC transporter permease [Rhizobium sp. NZLR1]MBX5208221.1 ABC transporter permease [Rhizobium sp. NZLR11]
MIGLLTACRIELMRILSLRPAFSVLILAVCIYAALYPQPYRNEALRDVPIALVDLDGTDSSRQFARRIDASADVAIGAELPDEPSAEREVFARQLYGILVIPKYFERDLLHGRQSPVALYADASYFLIYSRIAGGVSAVAKTFGVEVETARLIAAHVDPAIAAAASDPMPLTTVPLFNPQGGYATYLLPAAFVLILQQTLLIGVGLLGTLRDEGPASSPAGALATVLGKLLAYLILQTAVLPFYLIVLPYLYDIPRLGNPLVIFVFSLPFVVSVSALGMVVAALFRSPLTVQLVFAAIGIPFLFLAGFSWPTEAMPKALHYLALLVPSSSAINGIVSVSQLGASLSDVRTPFLTLWALALFYGCLAVGLEARMRRSYEARSSLAS